MMMVIKIVWLTLMLFELFCALGYFLLLPEEYRDEGSKSVHEVFWGDTVMEHIMFTLCWSSGIMGVLLLRTIIKDRGDKERS